MIRSRAEFRMTNPIRSTEIQPRRDAYFLVGKEDVYELVRAQVYYSLPDMHAFNKKL